MAFSAHKDKEQIKERYDKEEVFQQKMDQLAALVRASKHLVFFTGAGISTSTGIPDFRGPQGVWTLKAEGRKRTERTTDSLQAIPSIAHRAIVQLQKEGICKYLISQNCDGLHRRSGIPPNNISELHGNGNIEYCENCGYEYLRDYHCYRITRTSDHYTGRHCVQPINAKGDICKGRLLESTVDFGQSLPVEPLRLAEKNSKESDLHIVMGSSLTVRPACNMPKLTATYTSRSKPQTGNLVIINLQNTPLDDLASLRIYEKCDRVMEELMKRLNQPIPPFLLNRYCKVQLTEEAKNWEMKISGVEKGTTLGFEIPATIFRGVQILFTDKRNGKKQIVNLEAKESAPFVFRFSKETNIKNLSISFIFHFMGNYNEPSLSLSFPDNIFGNFEAKYRFTYNPMTGEWVTSLESSSSPIAPFPSNDPLPNNNNNNEIMIEENNSNSNIQIMQQKIINSDQNVYKINSMWATSSLCRNANNEGILLLLGGAPSSDRKSRPIHIYNLFSQQWDYQSKLQVIEDLDLEGNLLSSPKHAFVNQHRWGHTATVVDDHLIYLIGGFDNEAQYNDLHLINSIDFSIQSLPTTGKKPSYRAHHSTTYLPSVNSILLFGGCYCNGGPYNYYSDLYLLDLSNNHWSCLSKEREGDWPSKRAQHSSILINEHEVVVMGGVNENGVLLNDIWIFNLLNQRWRRLDTKLPFENLSFQQKDFRVHPLRSASSLVDLLLPSAKTFILYSSFNGIYLIDFNNHFKNNENDNWVIKRVDSEDDSIRRSCHAIASNKSTTLLIGGLSFDVATANSHYVFSSQVDYPDIVALKVLP